MSYIDRPSFEVDYPLNLLTDGIMFYLFLPQWRFHRAYYSYLPSSLGVFSETRSQVYMEQLHLKMPNRTTRKVGYDPEYFRTLLTVTFYNWFQFLEDVVDPYDFTQIVRCLLDVVLLNRSGLLCLKLGNRLLNKESSRGLFTFRRKTRYYRLRFCWLLKYRSDLNHLYVLSVWVHNGQLRYWYWGRSDLVLMIVVNTTWEDLVRLVHLGPGTKSNLGLICFPQCNLGFPVSPGLTYKRVCNHFVHNCKWSQSNVRRRP